MERVLVIGCPGSGKSTFARALSCSTGLPLIHLDMLYWRPDRTTVERAEFLSRLSEAMSQPAWIIDGNYASTMDLRMSVCDTIFFLDYDVEICLEGIANRRGKPRQDMPWVEPEDSEDLEFRQFVEGFRETGRPAVLELLKKYREKTIYTFTNRAQAQEFLSEVTIEGENDNEGKEF